MVARLHDAGLEVILDVVYNHTAEGNELGSTLSFKGIDNASYYRLIPGQERYYINDTGTGNTLNLSHPRVLQMVTDSLRYWVTEMHVDGFRFDLATILGRESYGFDEGGGFLDSCRQDPVLSDVKLIAEPWDCGPGGYQVGGFPPGWAEWNDRYRDTVRAFWKGDTSGAELARRLCASADKFNRRGRRTWSSVNFVTAHDGFTLHDIVSYNSKHNEANGEGNRDGTDNNGSWNCGVEGETEDGTVIGLRERQMRNMMATLLMSQGTPMILAGDEFARTQAGNNNAYCQDNDISWVDWGRLDHHQAMFQFTRRLIQLRNEYPILRRAALHDRRVGRGPAGARRHLGERHRPRDAPVRLAVRPCALPGDVDGWPRQGQRDQAPGHRCDAADDPERLSRPAGVRDAAVCRRRPVATAARHQPPDHAVGAFLRHRRRLRGDGAFADAVPAHGVGAEGHRRRR